MLLLPGRFWLLRQVTFIHYALRQQPTWENRMKVSNATPPLSGGQAPEKPWFVLDSRAMDVSRILASLAIFYFHVGLFCSVPLSFYAEEGVEYFIFLAGISYVLFSTSKPSRLDEFPDYLKKRFVSLFPMYLLINLGVFLGSFLHSSRLGRPFSGLEFLASAAGISQYIGWRYLTAPMWFVPFIMQVYLLLPLIDWVLQRANAVWVILAATVISWLLALWLSVSMHSDVDHLCWTCKMWSPVFRLPDVCVGVILGRLMLVGTRGRRTGLAAILLFGLLSWLSGLPQSKLVFVIFHLPFSGFVTPGILYGLTFVCLPIFSLMGTKLLRVLGRATLPFFLIQCAPLQAIGHQFGHQPVIWVAYFFVCWILALGCTVGLEKVTRGTQTNRSRGVKPAAG